MKSPLYLLDGYSLIYRSYFAFIRSPLRNPQGRNSSAIFGFFRSLFSIIQERKPEYFAIILDSKTPTFRHDMYPEYKATRQKTPDDLRAQIPVIEEIAAALRIPQVRVEGMEADDVIATIARMSREEERPCYIISGDKDLLQNIGPLVKVLKPDKGSFTELGREEVFASWSVYPEQIIDYLSLVGDTADNVPGAKGIGEKSASALLSEFSTIEKLYENLESISPAQKKKLEESRDNVLLSKSLVILRDDLKLQIGTEDLRLPPLDGEAAAPLFLAEGMKSLAAEAGGGGLPAKTGSGSEPVTASKGTSGSSPAASTAADTAPSAVSDTLPRAAPEAGEYTAVADLAKLDEWIGGARKAKYVAFDTETTDLDPYAAELVGFSLSFEEGRACYVPVQAPFGDGLGLQSVIPRLRSLLEDPDVRIIGQNLKFDYKIMLRLGVRMATVHFDTMIAAWILDADEGAYNMDRLAEKHLGYTTVHYAEVVGKGENFASVPLDIATRYAAEDADVTFRLYKRFAPLLKERKLEDLFTRIEMPLVRILAEMELEGIKLDSGVLDTYAVELERDLKTLQSEIYRLCGKEFNINSTKQLQEVLFTDRKLRPSKKTKTGYSTDTSVLEELSREDPVPEKILLHRTLGKLKSTYVDALPRLVNSKTGRLHTSFNQTGTATGRLSSKDPNLQNIPIREDAGRRIRSAFIPASGKVFLSADYAQIELVVLAHLSGDPGLGAAFQANSDVHRRTGSLIFGVPEAEVTADQRRIAKTINFGVMYGMSAFRLSRELNLSRKDADKFIEDYFRQYSRIRTFIDETVKEAEKTGKVTTILGRERVIHSILSKNKTEKMGAERIAVNTPIQGSAADIVKLAMIHLTAALKKNGLSARIILQVHDELILEVPAAEVEKTAVIVKKEMEAAVKLSVPLRVSIETGMSWGEMHL